MSRCRMISVWVGIVLFSAGLLMGRDCPAQTDLCVPDPCEGIANAVPGTCTPIPGGMCQPDDFSCNCGAGFTWQPGTKMCVGGPSQSFLPDTGQDLCYDNTTVIECPAPGQPFYGQDAQYVTNPMSYTVSPDGLTVTDNVTGLMWQREDDDTARSWAQAIWYCDDLAHGGHTDWRLPNAYELQSIVHYGRYNPAIDTTAFPFMNSTYYYWSSSHYPYASNNAWGVDFYDGRISDYAKMDTYSVRCVRGEETSMLFTVNGNGTVTDNETGLMWQQEDDNQRRNWQSALAYCEGLGLGGHSDWRLPDVKELRSIVDNTLHHSPAIDPAVFPGTDSDYYWSSSTYAYGHYGPNAAWYVYFNDGSVSYYGAKTLTYYVRCVR